MITPKPAVGERVVFLGKIRIDFYDKNVELHVMMEGTIIGVNYDKSKYTIEAMDNDGVVSTHRVPVSYIFSFEWGGVEVLNPKRNVKMFENAGYW